MMFNFFTCSILLSFVLVHSPIPTVHALCLPCKTSPSSENLKTFRYFDHRDVYSPNITSPVGETIWETESTVNITWDLHGIPLNITNTRGKALLGYLTDGDTDEHLYLDPPLADGFDIRQGYVEISVPIVPPRDDYIIVLFGDSGNRSPPFTIK